MLERVIAMGVVVTLLAVASAFVNADEAVPPIPARDEDAAEPTREAHDATVRQPASVEKRDEEPPEKERKKKRDHGEREHRGDRDEDDDREERGGKKGRRGRG